MKNLFHEIENFLNSHWVVKINLILLFFICLSPAVLFIYAWWIKTPVPGLTSFYGEAVWQVYVGVCLLVSPIVTSRFKGKGFLRFFGLAAAVCFLLPYLKYFFLTNDLHCLSYVLISIGVAILSLDQWHSKAPNYPPVVSGKAILSRTILLNEYTISIISLLILFALFGVYYSIEGVAAKFSGTQMASILGGVTSGPILKNLPKLKDWLYDLISNDIRRTNQYTAIIGTGPLATSFIHEDVRNKQPKAGVDEAFVLYAEQEELTPDLIELCQERFIGICRPSQFESRWISQIDFANLERIFIGTGNDLTNIERLGVFMDKMKDHQNKEINITIEIEDRDLIPFLDEAFSQWSDTNEDECGSQQNRNVTLQYISYSELAAHDYFQTAEPNYLKKATKDSTDGLTHYLNDLDAASIVLIGTGQLAREFIYFLAKIWHLPTKRNDENASPKIILMGNDEADGQPISDFRRAIYQLFPEICEYFKIEIVTLDFFKDQMDSSIYKESVWDDQKLKRIFLLNDDTYRNVELVNVFTNKTYLDDMVLTCSDGSRREIFIANKSYKKLHDAMSISSDKLAASKLHHVNSIGLLSELSKDEFIFNNVISDITQQIKGILTKEEPIKQEDDATEKHNDLARQRSAKSLAQHLHVKLLILGLETRRLSEIDKKEDLIIENKDCFYEALVSYCEDGDRWGKCGNHKKVVHDLEVLFLEMEDNELSVNQQIVKFYNACEGHDNPIASLINCEHDRWRCYHQINKWKLPEKINGETADNYLTKESPLLMRLDSLEGDLRNKAIVRAFNQYLCIPEILANAGCMIQRLKDVEEH